MWLIAKSAVAGGAFWYAYTQGKWHWWIFFLAIIPCAVFVQFRAGMTAEMSGMTKYALARPGQVIFWSLIVGTVYAVIVTAAVAVWF